MASIDDFETALTSRGFYFESPSVFLPGANRDAEAYTADQLLDILTHEENKTGNFVSMVRKRSEQAGYMTYYFKDVAGFEYFKVSVPNATAENTSVLGAVIGGVKRFFNPV